MTVTADSIVQCARSWIGTRYHHQGRLKADAPRHRGGVDCLGLLVGIARELQLCDADGTPLADFDRTDYALNVASEPLCITLRRLLREKAVADMAHGDVALFALDRSPQHLAVLTSNTLIFHMIHAYASARAVVENRLDNQWKSKLAGVYSLTCR